MHLYVDESYRPTQNPKVYVLGGIAVYDQRSQRAIRRAVRDTRNKLESRLRTTGRLVADDRIPELKGAKHRQPFIPGLNEYVDIRNDFFRRLCATARFTIYVLYCDRQEIERWSRLWRRRRSVIEELHYGRRLQNLIAHVRILPPYARLIGVTIDSQNSAYPAQEGRKLYTWRKRRHSQRLQRSADRRRHRRWIQQIGDFLKRHYSGRHVRVWLVPSHLHPCIQAADVIANFAQRYQSLSLPGPPYAYGAVSRRCETWFSGYRIIAGRVCWLHNWRVRKTRRLSRLLPSPLR